MPRAFVQFAEDSEWARSRMGASFPELWCELRGTLCREHRTRRVERLETLQGTVYVKRFTGVQTKNWLRIRWCTQPRARSQAGREQRICTLLRERGFHAPRVLLHAEELGWLRERRSLLLMTALEGPALCEAPESMADDALLLEVAEALGAVLRTGLYLPDLGTDHVFLLQSGDFGLLDFTNARSAPQASPREVARALVRFFRSPGAGALVARGLHQSWAERYLEAAARPDALSAWRRLAQERLA